jgi:heme/copper-type cytochrome/quinol oxidase subunit 4
MLMPAFAIAFLLIALGFTPKSAADATIILIALVSVLAMLTAVYFVYRRSVEELGERHRTLLFVGAIVFVTIFAIGLLRFPFSLSTTAIILLLAAIGAALTQRILK